MVIFVFVQFFEASLCALEISAGFGAQSHYSASTVSAGYTKELRLGIPIGNTSFGSVTCLAWNYYGMLEGIRFSYEQALIGDNKSLYSLCAGVYYTYYRGKPVVAIKDDYVDQMPDSFGEIGVLLSPLKLKTNEIVFSFFNLNVGIDTQSSKKLSVGLTFFTFGGVL